MKKLKTTVIILILFSLVGFNNEKSSFEIKKNGNENHLIPDDFYFVINSGRNDSYNSQYNSFYRKYLDDEKTIKVELTKEEKEKIYSYMIKIDFFKMPMKFEPKESIIDISDPSFTKGIFIYSNGKQKYVSYVTGFTSDKNKKRAKPFLDFYKMIWEILYKKEEILKMEDSDFFYK